MRETMTQPSYWIARTTMDVYSAYLNTNRIGAGAQTLARLTKLTKGDLGIFYISTNELHKLQQVQKFRSPFTLNGNIESVPIIVDTLPEDKKILFSASIKFFDPSGTCSMHEIINKLDFIKKKNHWGSYLMQAYIKVSKKDFDVILGSLV